MICASPITRGPNKGKPATGTDTGYKRHRAHLQQPCEACAQAHREYANEQNARRKNMICADPITRGPLAGQPATGTYIGARRHYRAGETPCVDCLQADKVYDREVKGKWRARRPDPDRAPRCAICGGRLADHRLGDWCRSIGVEKVAL